MQKKWLAAVGSGVLLASSVIGIGLASANTARAVPSAPPAVAQLAGTVQATPAAAAGEVLDNEEKETVDKDNVEVQEGSQVEDNQNDEKENEDGIAEEPGENLPGGGHADPAGTNAGHDFQGVE